MKQLQGTELKRFLRDWRRANPSTLDIALVLDSVSYPVNVASLFRIADAAGVSKVFLCNATPLPDKIAARVSRAKEHEVPWFYEKRTEDILDTLRQEGYTLIALEITDGAAPYYELPYPVKVALIVGNEDHGVTRAALSRCSRAVFVPMLGKGLSMNVHVSTGVVLYHILAQHLHSQSQESVT